MKLGQMPRLGFGTGPLGNLTESVPEDVSDSALRAATLAGIRYFDTAPLYGFGLAELRLGRHLRTLKRSDYYLSTKVGRRFEPLWGGQFDKGSWFDPLRVKVVMDYTRDGILRSLEQSVNRLGIDRFDAVFVHDIDRRNRGDAFDADYKLVIDQAIPTLLELKRAGHIGSVGVGINEADVAADIIRNSEIDSLMLAGRLSILDFESGREALALAHKKGVQVIAGAVFNSGMLARPVDSSATFDYREPTEGERERLGRLQRLCAEYNVPIQAAALQFPLRKPGVVSVVMGTSRPERVRQNAEWFDFKIADAFWDALQ